MLIVIASIICKLLYPLYWIIVSLYAFANGNSKKWNRILSLLLFGMTINALLKSIFKVPLAAHLNKTWYAFPSGHLQAAVLFFCWLAYEEQKPWLFTSVPLLLVTDAWAMWMMGYHSWFDLFGGAISGTLLLIWYWYLCKYTSEQNQSYFGLIFALVGTIFILVIPRQLHDHWGCIGALLGLSLGQLIPKKLQPKNHFPVVKNFFITMGLTVIGGVCYTLKSYITIQWYWFLLSFFTCLWISYGSLIIFIVF